MPHFGEKAHSSMRRSQDPIAEGDCVCFPGKTLSFYAAQCEQFAAQFGRDSMGVPRIDPDFADLATVRRP